MYRIGFGEANARDIVSMLIKVAKQQWVRPLDYFGMNETAVKLAVDSYAAMYSLRPAGVITFKVSPLVNSVIF